MKAKNKNFYDVKNLAELYKQNNIKDIPEWASSVKVKLHRVSCLFNGNIDFDFELTFPDAATQMLFEKFEKKRLINCLA